MYYIDTPTQKIDAFDYDISTGTISNRRTAVAMPEDFGAPDGMTIDADGNLWVAFWGKSCVRCIDPSSGRVRHSVRLPVSNVTACAFGGEKLDELYITTARESLGEQALAEQPAAGGLFRAHPGVKGVQAFEYAG
jgi:sugar lactone lactonase YvrE